MTDRGLDLPERVLAVGAHPDDVEFGCGATLAKWAAAGARCEILVLTDGSKGTWDPGTDPRALVARREREQHDAADALGVEVVHFGGFVDGELEASPAAREHVCQVLRDVRPDVVLGHDPWKRYRLHPDHRVAGELLIGGVVAARDPHFFPDLGPPHRPRTMLLFEAEVVDHLEQVDATASTKVDALLRHRSQWRSTMGIDPDAPEHDRSVELAAFAERVLAELDDGTGGHAERFKRVDEL